MPAICYLLMVVGARARRERVQPSNIMIDSPPAPRAGARQPTRARRDRRAAGDARVRYGSTYVLRSRRWQQQVRSLVAAAAAYALSGGSLGVAAHPTVANNSTTRSKSSGAPGVAALHVFTSSELSYAS